MQGYNLGGLKDSYEPSWRKEVLTVRCRGCGNTWKEEVEFRGTVAGYARTYDRCDLCIRTGE
jgi:hypothetical protein